MMKKLVCTTAVSAVFLLSGCTVPFMLSEDTTPEPVVVPQIESSAAATLAQENPEQLFFDFAKASGGNLLNSLNESIPDRELLVKQDTEVSIVGDFDMEGTPMGGGTGTFSVKADALLDYSDENNLKLAETVDVQVDALGGFIKVDAKGEIRVVEQSLFANVEKLDFNFPGATSDIKEIAQKFMGQWYGGTFTEIQESFDLDGVDLESMFAGGDYGLKLVELIDDIATNPENHVSFGKFVKEEDGYYYFEVTPKKETYEAIAEILVKTLPVTGSQLEEVQNDIQDSINNLVEQPVLLAYTPEDSRYFKIATLDGSYTAEKTAEGCAFFTNADEYNTIDFSAKNGEYTLDITELEKTFTLLSGTYADDSLTFEFTVPSYDYEKGENVPTVMANGSFTKTADVWAGEITSPVPELENSKLVFSDVTGTTKTATAKVSAVYDGKTVGNVTMNFSVEKPETVTVEKPENIKSFKTLEEEFESELNTLYGYEESDISIGDSEDDIFTETSDDEENDYSVDAADVLDTESAVDSETVVDPITDSVGTIDETVLADESTEADTATNDSVIAEIEPLLQEMAQMMNEDPTPETQAKFMEMKEQIDSIAAENGVTEDQLGEMFMKAVSENQPAVPAVPAIPAQ